MRGELEKIFEANKGKFDTLEPESGHFERFKKRINTKKSKKRSTTIWFTQISVAASIALLVGIWMGSNYSSKGLELAEVSTEMKETQNYFLATIQKELTQVELERNNETEKMISDALERIETLEKEYELLTIELKESSEDRRIIYAMVSNFQSRIEILQSLLIRIESVKELKRQNHENYV